MKLKFISMAVFSALTLGVATNASAATTVNGGTGASARRVPGGYLSE